MHAAPEVAVVVVVVAAAVVAVVVVGAEVVGVVDGMVVAVGAWSIVHPAASTKSTTTTRRPRIMVRHTTGGAETDGVRPAALGRSPDCPALWVSYCGGMRSLRFGLVVAAILLLAGACSASEEASPTTTTTAAPQPPPSTTTTLPAATTTTAAAVDLAAIVITCAPGTGPDFSGLIQNDPDFDEETLRCATFDDGEVDGGSFVAADATGASFRNTTITQTRFDRTTLIGADFTGATLDQVRFGGADLSGADLATATLGNIRWEQTTCPDGVSSDEAGGSCADHLTPLPVEVDATDAPAAIAPIEIKPLCAPDSGPDFMGQQVDSTDFSRQDLRCARFDGATVTGGDFTRVDASAAVFDGATLDEAVFDSTTLVGASFSGTVLQRVRFRNANLIGADITDAEFGNVRWTNTTCPNGVNSEAAGGTCLGSRTALDLPEVDFDEIRDADITVRQGNGLTTYTIANDVLFEFDSDALTANAAAKLTEVVASIGDRFEPGVEIQVLGFADAIGEAAYNLDLSQRRADNVAAVLEADPALGGFTIVAVGLGERQPVAPNTNPDGSDNSEGRALNRRVEIVVRNR